MIINFEQLKPSERYFAMVQTIIPRPIAWVLTDNGTLNQQGEPNYNLAPFSFFTGICSDPPLLMLSIGKKPAGEEAGNIKDTSANIQAQKRFVVHIANTDQILPLNQSAETLNHDVSEVTKLGLKVQNFDGFDLPRLSICQVAMGCSLYRVDEIGNTPQTIIYGKIETLFIDDQLLEPHETRLIVNPQKLNPLSRLGGSYYGDLGQVLEAQRPK